MSYTYQSPAEAAAEIRGKLKALYGITSRQVSVRAKSFSMGSSLDVTINDPAVDIREVRNVADSKEKIDRDMYGEILSGGNHYLDVRYGDKAAEAFAAANADAIAKLVEVLPERGSTSSVAPPVEIAGKNPSRPSIGRREPKPSPDPQSTINPSNHSGAANHDHRSRRRRIPFPHRHCQAPDDGDPR